MKKRSHATTIPVAEDVVMPDPEPFEVPGFTNGEATLTDEEIEYFKEHGFLVKQRYLGEDENFERIVDYVWENIPSDIARRDDPETWLEAPGDAWTEELASSVGLFGRGSLKMRSREGIGTEPMFLEKIANHPRMRKMVSTFIGDPVKQVSRVRGVYALFPKVPGAPTKLSPHTDYTAAQMSAMVFVDEVPPGAGGFTVWPGSHRLLHRYWATLQGGVVDQVEAYAQARDDLLRVSTPVEFHGRPGDVLFWHPRLLHSPGINRSAEWEKPVVRLIVPCDYQKDGMTYFDDLVDGPGPNHQWWVDTRNFEEDVPTAEGNLWDGWAFRQS